VIRQALSALPTRPIVYIAPLIVIAVLSFYYADLYSRCTAAREFRASLNEALERSGAGSAFRLADAIGFAWDRVRIVTGFRPERPANECPFGWNWADGERERLIAGGHLTALLFVHEGVLVNFLELRSDEVAFAEMDSSLSVEEAVFAVDSGADSGYRLSLKR
jgi:hypothetical protein